MSSQGSTSEASAYGEIQEALRYSPFESSDIHNNLLEISDTSQNSSSNVRRSPQSYVYFGADRRSQNLPFLSNPGVTIPEVTFIEPRSGVPGSHITIYLRSRQPLELNPGPQPNLIFSGLQIPSHLRSNGFVDEYYTYTLTAVVPVVSTMISPAICPLYLTLNDAAQMNIRPISIGDFEYWQPMEYPTYAPLELGTRKRRITSTSAVEKSAPVKRMASQTFLGISSEPSNPHTESFSHPMMTPSQIRQTSYSFPAHDLAFQSIYGQNSSASLQNDAYGHAAPLQTHSVNVMLDRATSASQPTGDTPITTSSSLFEPINNLKSGGNTYESPVNIRTSFLRRPISRPKLRTQLSAPQFNPYSIPKATLQIQGDLKEVLKDWTNEEIYSQRRIVQFDRSQTGSVITTSFQVISKDEWDPKRISVNCIWWEEKKEAFITSVDLISLLESIMALRFTLQEKNRIRRNLEGFRPLTIGKSKVDKEPFSEDVEAFFKLVMGLGEPRPRSIEKDVKVFPWNSLAAAMKKVVDKYSASYASTAGTMDLENHSRNFTASPLRTNTSQSDATSSPPQSGTQSVDVDSRHASPYPSRSATTTTMPRTAGEDAQSIAAFPKQFEEGWPSFGSGDSVASYKSSMSDKYEQPDYASSDAAQRTNASSHKRRDRSRGTRALPSHRAVDYEPYCD